MEVATNLAPPLSKTFQSSVLWNPGHLDRITIDDIHYQHYKEQQVASGASSADGGASSADGGASQRGRKKMGDKFFFIQKDIPVEQNYSLTANKYSDVRPWDQLVDRPLTTNRVRSKEVNLPYPQEHPYSSHIPHYNTFPDPYPHPPSLRTNPPLTPQPHHPVTPPSQLPTTALDYQENTIEIQQADQPDTIQQDTIQHDEQPKTPFVDHLPCNPPHPHYVERKASDFGMRIESMDLKWNNDPMGKMPEIEHLLWQLPKGYTHKRCITYPTPSHQFSRQPTTPNYLQLPRSNLPSTPSTGTCYSYPAHVQESMADFHKLSSRTTSYSDHYPAHSIPSSRSSIDHTHRSKGSMRPHTSESRGKYYCTTPLFPGTINTSTTNRFEFIPLRIQDEEVKVHEQNKNELATHQAQPEDRNGSEEKVTTTSDSEVEEAETGEMTEEETGVPADSTYPEGEEKIEIEGNSSVLPSTPSAPPPPRIVPHYRSLSSDATIITPVNQVMTKLYKFPYIEQKRLRFPTIVNLPIVPHHTPPPMISAVPYMKLEPLQYSSPLATPMSSTTCDSSSCIHRRPSHLRTTNRRAVLKPPHEKFSNGEIVRRFTHNLQREGYYSPDMRKVTMKEGKRHDFFGHHGYDYR